ncbi:hypothetical protein IWW50_002670 [Coemansia erecta]|nr:hypothetical protein GGF43_002611 [Coemansia sp. RSA 2618]KAJ2825832.1 hypothetical protein IWW50_002670 [Coemansia erecta]
MKFAALITLVVSALTGYAQPANEAAAICSKACEAAPSAQRETCMRVCSQFAEKSAELAAPAMSSSAAKNMPTMSVKNSEAPAMASNSAPASAKEKMHGEDNDEDHEAGEKSASGSASHESAGVRAVQMGVGAVVVALSAAFF